MRSAVAVSLVVTSVTIQSQRVAARADGSQTTVSSKASQQCCGWIQLAIVSRLPLLSTSLLQTGTAHMLDPTLLHVHCIFLLSSFFRFDHGGECRIKPGLKKYACELTLDPNTADRHLALSEGNRKVTYVREEQTYPDHPDRFDCAQVLCREGLPGRYYWEAEWSGVEVEIAVAYKTIQRKGEGNERSFGGNDKSWSLRCRGDRYSAWHNDNKTDVPPSPHSSRVGVDLDWPAGTLSFYSVSSDGLTHLHTFNSTFTEPLYPGFYVSDYDSSVTLCQIT
ncbi:hypothetical protein ACEWY4_017860 [Coilia grayii]|uniref:B30.2/SPRY domain-containing protein n=1 Tax=Coilia grayii TaxID=363190 RepID=A0ABD1JI35_9TELE